LDAVDEQGWGAPRGGLIGAPRGLRHDAGAVALRVVVRVALWPFGPVTVPVAPVALRETSRVADWPFGPVIVALVPVALRATLRDAVFPFGPVVLDCTSPCWRATLRVALWPLAPLMVVWRSRASAGTAAIALPITAATRAAIANEGRMCGRWKRSIEFMVVPFGKGSWVSGFETPVVFGCAH
jgi:hypothetical protein